MTETQNTLDDKLSEKHEETVEEGVVISSGKYEGGYTPKLKDEFHFKVDGDTVYIAKSYGCMACGTPNLYHLLLAARKQPEVYGFLRDKEIVLLDPSMGSGRDLAKRLREIAEGNDEVVKKMEDFESALRERKRRFFEPDHGMAAYMVKIKEQFGARSVTYAEGIGSQINKMTKL